MSPNKISPYLSQIKHKIIWVALITLGIVSTLYILSTISSSPVTTTSITTPQKLTVINASPSESQTPASVLSFLFNRSINLNQVKAQISPSTPYTLFLTTDSKTLFVQPNQPWKLNTEYNISILDQQGNLLYSYKVTFIDPSILNNYPPDQIRPGGI